ncbi:YdcF family protein [Clostridium sp.]|uniref:YdcF family protein n=1 Tax=Clostridium sp. TaxID=1506 RepID=UPI0026277B9A|nr:YdcF family protein [Clostridium sp.]
MKNKIELMLGTTIVLYTILINTVYTKISFSKELLLIGVILIIIYYLKNKDIKSFNKIYKFGKPFIALGLVIFLVIETLIISFPKNNLGYSKYVIVLGAGVRGTTPSLTLIQRLDATLEYVNKQEEDVIIIVSGGQGKGEDISEALAMKTYLVSKGIKENYIVMEDKSTTTNENLKFSKSIIETISSEPADKLNITVITSDFHAYRSSKIAKKLGYNKPRFYSNKTKILLTPIMYLREALAFIKFLLNYNNV